MTPSQRSISIASACSRKRRVLMAQVRLLDEAEKKGAHLSPFWEGKTPHWMLGKNTMGWREVGDCLHGASQWANSPGLQAFTDDLRHRVRTVASAYTILTAYQEDEDDNIRDKASLLYMELHCIMMDFAPFVRSIKDAFDNAFPSLPPVGVGLDDPVFLSNVFSTCLLSRKQTRVLEQLNDRLFSLITRYSAWMRTHKLPA